MPNFIYCYAECLYAKCRYAESHFVEGRILFIVMLNVCMLNFIMLNANKLNVNMLNLIMLNVIMLNFIMLNVIMPSVIMLNVIMVNVVLLSVVSPLAQLTAVSYERKTLTKPTEGAHFRQTVVQFSGVSSTLFEDDPGIMSEVETVSTSGRRRQQVKNLISPH